MAERRYRRDLIGHFARKEQRTQQPCTHACCRGYRVHSSNFPVILPDRTLRRASDEDLTRHFQRVSRDESPAARRAEAQLLHEMERRDEADERKREREQRRVQHREAVAVNRAAQRQEREAEYERIKAEAEAGTQGYLVNARGRARGISDAEILTGREDVFRRYATDEARDYFAAHPRPTASYFRGQDTRVHAKATEPRRRQYGVAGARGGSARRGGRGRPLTIAG